MAALARLKPDAFFVQIGANEEPSRNPLSELVHNSRWRGVLVDPIPPVAHELHRTYGSSSRVSVVQAAIASSDEERAFFYDATESSNGGTPIPVCMAGALHREVLFMADYHSDLEQHVTEIVTPCFTFESFCHQYRIESFDVLRVDTAGDEAELLSQVDIERFRPTVIIYNHWLLGAGVRHACTERLAAHGFQMLDHGRDTWCVNTHNLPAGRGMALKAIWRWLRAGEQLGRNPRVCAIHSAARRLTQNKDDNGAASEITFPLSEQERRYLINHYDDRTPLPAGAISYLRSDNPRLAALRSLYASLDLPALNHHMWAGGRVAEGVELQHFRGDNLYVWHYPEHPRAMALKLFLYMRQVEAGGGGPLLGQLSEDGAFGCWTTGVAGYGKLSRDLLDSVNEIVFLDRHLDVLTRPGLRVLDIGAGYGRLAYRMAEAAENLTDYCCVDAVPESTFLAEYYLNFRGSSPPARALPIDQVSSLLPGAFDLAVNVHSFSECTLRAITWWIQELVRLRVPHLFVVPNEADGILSREPDGSYHQVLPLLESAGYRPIVKERAIQDRAAREMLMLNDNFYLFSLSPE